MVVKIYFLGYRVKGGGGGKWKGDGESIYNPLFFREKKGIMVDALHSKN